MPKGQENLIPASKRSKAESQANGRKGGKASGAARRRKKALRAMLKEAVSMRLKDLPEDVRAGIMVAARLNDDSLTIGDAILGSLIWSACGGNSQMMKVLLDVLGETPDVRLKEREMKIKEKVQRGSPNGENLDDVKVEIYIPDNGRGFNDPALL